MSAFPEYKVRANHSGLMDEELVFSAPQHSKGCVFVNVTVTNDAGSTTIIAVNTIDLLAALHMVSSAIEVQ